VRNPISVVLAGSVALTIFLMGLPIYASPGHGQLELVESYVAATEALAADDFDKARASLLALARQSQGDLKVKAEVASSARDSMTLRSAFREVSEEVIALGVPMAMRSLSAECFATVPAGSKNVEA
jgi:hypothetical protein